MLPAETHSPVLQCGSDRTSIARYPPRRMSVAEGGECRLAVIRGFITASLFIPAARTVFWRKPRA
jgi:hypothetical protein